MNPLQKRAIARLAYEEISAAIEKWESLSLYGYLPVSAHWTGTITVDGEIFEKWQLKQEKGVEK